MSVLWALPTQSLYLKILPLPLLLGALPPVPSSVKSLTLPPSIEKEAAPGARKSVKTQLMRLLLSAGGFMMKKKVDTMSELKRKCSSASKETDALPPDFWNTRKSARPLLGLSKRELPV